MNDIEVQAVETQASDGTIQRNAPLVFIHSAPRTSSTWFWTKFRNIPSTLCYYEPFNDKLVWMTPDRANTLAHDSWESRHGPTDPYYREYGPLIKETKGVDRFDPAMAFQWFIPEGGLRGELRPGEKDYLSLLIRHADAAGKVPVFGGWRSLGRIWAMRNAFGGYHIFQHRNLWRQWLSMLSYKRQGSRTFYISVVDTLCRDDEPYFAYLVAHGLRLAADPRTGQDPAASPLLWTRSYPNPARDETQARQLELLPEHHMFALFIGLHIYLYLHAETCADLAADVTRMARDGQYREDIEREVQTHTGLAVSVADANDSERHGGVDFDSTAIDWDAIREHARVAVQMLSLLADPARLTASANALIDGTQDEMRKMGAPTATPLTAFLITPSKPTAGSPDTKGIASPGSAGATVKTIGLCMIVKNEAAVIRRCLNSVRPLLDYVVVEDTGSTDGTQEIIRGWLKDNGIAGEVFDEPWRDFAHNRSVALAKLRENTAIDYALIMDADDVMEYEQEFDAGRLKSSLTADHYYVAIRLGGTKYGRAQICSNRKAYYYRGVLHEFLEGPQPGMSSDTAEGLLIVAGVEGARSRDPEKYQRDAATIERALATETDPFMRSRYTFYLAQSYRDFGQTEKSIEHYLCRADMGFWDEEIYIALCRAAQLQTNAERPAEEILATWRRAIKVRPGRAEAIHGIAHYCRTHGRNEEGFQEAKAGLKLTEVPPPAGLFVEAWIYEYALLDEYAINAYWSGHYRECLDASLRILSHPSCPEHYRKRVLDNAKFAASKLPAAPNLGSNGEVNLVEQHALVPARQLRSPASDARVLVAILAKQKEPSLPLYLECIEALDYPKSSIVLYIRTNNNTDRTERILREWVGRVGHLYAAVEFDAEDVAARVEQFGVHEWNATRFSVLGRIRNISLQQALAHDCAFYFVSDVDNFVRSCTLRELVALNLPIVAPLLRSIDATSFYSNFHAEIDSEGYYKSCDQYHWILNRWTRGVVEVPVVHCTYLIRADVLDDLTFQDATKRHEYVIFSESARKSSVPQYLDNRQVYGFVTFDADDDHFVEGGIDQARRLLEVDRAMTPLAQPAEKPMAAPPPVVRPIAETAGAEAQLREKFGEIYQTNEWGYGSGVGSLPINNVKYMEFVQSFIQDAGIKSIVDFGCGDWQFSRFINWNGARYLGVDLVPGVIESNRRAFGHDDVTFEVFESLDALPEADLLLCKDVFQHLPNELVLKYLAVFKHKFKYLLITNDDQPAHLVNSDIPAGGWRPVRLDSPPFSELAPPVLSWTITWGGWKPTHKATCLMNAVVRQSTTTSGIGEGSQVKSSHGGSGSTKSLKDLRQIHLINLDRSTNRLAKFHERNSHLDNVRRVSATDGALVNREELVENGTITSDLAYTPGALGCALSHIGLWKKAVEQQRVVTVFEDDVICARNFDEELERIESSLPPDWDFIQWGHNFNPLFLWTDLGFSKANLRFYDQRPSQGSWVSQVWDVPSAPMRLLHSYGLLAYSVSPEGARKLLESCIPLRSRLIPFPGTGIIAEDTGIDCAMSGAYGSMQAFVCIPPLVIHDDTLASDRIATDNFRDQARAPVSS